MGPGNFRKFPEISISIGNCRKSRGREIDVPVRGPRAVGRPPSVDPDDIRTQLPVRYKKHARERAARPPRPRRPVVVLVVGCVGPAARPPRRDGAAAATRTVRRRRHHLDRAASTYDRGRGRSRSPRRVASKRIFWQSASPCPPVLYPRHRGVGLVLTADADVESARRVDVRRRTASETPLCTPHSSRASVRRWRRPLARLRRLVVLIRGIAYTSPTPSLWDRARRMDAILRCSRLRDIHAQAFASLGQPCAARLAPLSRTAAYVGIPTAVEFPRATEA